MRGYEQTAGVAGCGQIEEHYRDTATHLFHRATTDTHLNRAQYEAACADFDQEGLWNSNKYAEQLVSFNLRGVGPGGDKTSGNSTRDNVVHEISYGRPKGHAR